jgi:D-hexose-6-phosphate mutarotase
MSANIEFKQGRGGLPAISVSTPWSTGEFYLHGAHVTEFQKKDENYPVLWMSKESLFDPAKPIRGGVPLIFPWFGPRDGKASHGFARVSEWTLSRTDVTDAGQVCLTLELSKDSFGDGYSDLKLEYVISFSDKLELELKVQNLSKDKSLSFEQCLHTYFTVGEIADVSVSGLKGVSYLDKVGGNFSKVEQGDVIKVTSEVDRVYQHTSHPVEIRDAKLGRTILVQKEGALSTVVWNPWIAKSKAMADFGDEEYHGMICVESGSVVDNKLELKPGGISSMKVTISSRQGIQ